MVELLDCVLKVKGLAIERICQPRQKPTPEHSNYRNSGIQEPLITQTKSHYTGLFYKLSEMKKKYDIEAFLECWECVVLKLVNAEIRTFKYYRNS